MPVPVGNVVRLGLNAGLALFLVGGCDRRVEPSLPESRYDILEQDAKLPDFLRGSVLEHVVIYGTEAQVISGYGMVVNLDNTGRDDGIPGRVRERILEDASRLGVSMPRTDGSLGELSSTALLSDPAHDRRTRRRHRAAGCPPG